MKPIENQFNRQDVFKIHYSALFKFIKKKNSEGAKEYLVASGLYRSIENLNKFELLYFSACNNLTNLIDYLLGLCCDINARDYYSKCTPLIVSVRMHYIATTKILLSAGADILALNTQNISALHLLSNEWTRLKLKSIIGMFLEQLKKRYSSNEELAKNLIATNHHLNHVSVLGDSDIIECMIQQNSPVDFVDMIFTQSTAMHMAVLLSDSKIVEVLLKYHSDVNMVDAKYGRTPLYNLYKDRFEEGYCAERSKRKIEILKALLKRGSSVTTCTSDGVFQGKNVLIYGFQQAIKILIESGLDCKVKDNRDQRNVLHYLARNDTGLLGYVWLKDYIRKFDLNSRDKSGQSPLFTATVAGNYVMCEILIKLSAIIDLKDSTFNMTPLHYAYTTEDDILRNKCRKCGEILLMYDADPQILIVKENGEESTIFDAALEKNDFERLEPIVAHIAILEKRGVTITEIIRSRINSHELLKDYFDKCRDLLVERISGRVLLFDLLTSDKRKMARYLANDEIVQVLREVSCDVRVKHCRYYKNVLIKLGFEGRRYRDLKLAAVEPLCKIFQDRFDKTHIVIDKVMDYLNNESLRQLANVDDIVL